VETDSGRGTVLLIHGLWFRPAVWTPWLPELDEAGYDAIVLSWGGEDRAAASGRPGAGRGSGRLLRDARAQAAALPCPPIVIGHGSGGAVAERLLTDGTAMAAISLAPVPGGYPAVRAAARLVRHQASVALLGLRGRPVVPTFSQFRRTIAGAGGETDARYRYERHVAPGRPREVLLHGLRRRVSARGSRPRRGPLLLVSGGKDELIAEMSIALLHRDYRRRQPDAVTDYQVFPGLDHTLGLGTREEAVLFYCLDWLTAQNM
jgi:non-heme chloroperoxidase